MQGSVLRTAELAWTPRLLPHSALAPTPPTLLTVSASVFFPSAVSPLAQNGTQTFKGRLKGVSSIKDLVS